MADRTEANQFISIVAPIIQKYAKQYGYKVASPIIAQACSESRYGKSELAYKYFNYFGMKCGSGWNGKSVNLKTKEEYVVGILTPIRDNFRVYDSMEEGIEGYFKFISYSRYNNLKRAETPEQYLTFIKEDGYATSSKYYTTCMGWVDNYNLRQYDNLEVSNNNTSNVVFSAGEYVITASSLRVRIGAGLNFRQKTQCELSEDGRKHSNANGSLIKGTNVTVKNVINLGTEVWGQIPSGYIALMIKNKSFVQRVINNTKQEAVTTIKQFSLIKDGETQLSNNFKVKEFKCKDGYDTILIDLTLVNYLQKIRDYFNKPVIINSAYRTTAYNAKVGGATKSKHLYGMACDIKINGVAPKVIAAYAETLGILGIGLYDSFVHVDTRTTKSFWYSSKQIKYTTFK